MGEFLKMFWTKKKKEHKAKRLTQREIISQIEALSSGESVSYRLPKAYDIEVAKVEFNMDYPWRGSKYILSTQTVEDAKPTGEKERLLESDEAKDIAAWLSQRRGKLSNLAED
jgi:hypothetical protein